MRQKPCGILITLYKERDYHHTQAVPDRCRREEPNKKFGELFGTDDDSEIGLYINGFY